MERGNEREGQGGGVIKRRGGRGEGHGKEWSWIKFLKELYGILLLAWVIICFCIWSDREREGWRGGKGGGGEDGERKQERKGEVGREEQWGKNSLVKFQRLLLFLESVMLVVCVMSLQYESLSQGWICSDN